LLRAAAGTASGTLVHHASKRVRAWCYTHNRIMICGQVLDAPAQWAAKAAEAYELASRASGVGRMHGRDQRRE